MDPVLKSQLITSVQRYFLEFLEHFELTADDRGLRKGEKYYLEQAKLMIREKKNTLYVNVSHLAEVRPELVTFDPTDLQHVIESKYMMVRDALNAAVPELLGKLEDPELQRLVKQAREKDETKFVASFWNMGTHNGIRDLRTDQLGKLVTVCGTVTRTTEMKPELLVGTYQCNVCSREVSGVVQQFKCTMPGACPGRNCGNRTSWTLLAESRTTRWGDWQRIRLQESEKEVPAGSMPRSMDVIVRDECCDRCKPGDKVHITGSLIVVPDVPSMMNPSELTQQTRRSLNTRSDSSFSDGVKGLSGMGNRDLTYKLSFFGGYIEMDSEFGQEADEEDARTDAGLFLTQNERDRFMAIRNRSDCFDRLASMIAPGIEGHLEVKKGILLLLVGGLVKKTDEGIKLRGDINICLLGDPATAKSAILKWVSTFLPKAVFASGKASTAAGLTASVVKEADLDQEKVIQPGALMLADNGVCCIDEFERMDAKDQSAIHEAMEQQTITLSKAGIQATLNARTSILASCLPKAVYYQPTQPLHKNCDLSAPIMSRFDLMFVMQDIHDETNDHRVAKHILALHRQTEEETSSQLSPKDLMRYIRYARAHKPKISQEAKKQLVRSYKALRKDRHSYMRGHAGVTVRQLESLIRLSEAIARVNLSDQVTAEHAKEAFDLQMNSLKRVEHENIDLGVDAPDAVDEAEPTHEGPAVEEAPAERRPRRMRLTFAEYQRIGQMLIRYLAQQFAADVEVKEGDLITWYMEQIEDSIQTQVQLLEQQHLIQAVINRMIDKDRVIVVVRPAEDPLRPEGRVLIKHPNVVPGDVIAS
jgi:DNA replication licensing factor MCM6